MLGDDPRDDGEDFLYELSRESRVRKLVAYLRLSEKANIRRRAAEILGNLPEITHPEEERQAVDALVTAVREDEADSVRAAAIDALYLRGEDSLDRLVEELASADLDESAEDATDVLTRWLSADRPAFRMVAAAALGQREATSAVPDLVDALSDDDARVRMRAARACGQVGHPAVVDPLADRLTDDRLPVREAAAEALASIGTERALAPLVPLTRADEQSLRLVAVNELGDYGSLDPIIALVRALEDSAHTVQRAAALSILQLLTSLPEDERERGRQTIVEQLRHADAPTTVPVLVEVASDADRAHRRRTAVWMLSRIAEDAHRSEVVDCLVDLLDDGDESVRRLAAEGLTSFPGPDLEKDLLMYVREERGTPESRDLAREVLDDICDGEAGELVDTAVDYTYVSDPTDYTKE